MTDTLDFVLSFSSIALAAIIGIVRFRQINNSYHPFLFCIWIGSLNEILSFFVQRLGYSNGTNNTIYVLVESIIVTIQFEQWHFFKRHKYFFYAILISLVLTWAGEALFRGGINYTMSYFRIYYPFIVVIMSLTLMGSIISSERKNILLNSRFLICIGFVIYFANKVIIGMFWLYSIRFSHAFSENLFSILVYINLFCNLIYAFAILWMPTKLRFSMQS